MTRSIVQRRRSATAAGTVAAVVGFWLVATAGRPWRLFDRGPFSSDFFDVQAQSLLDGRLSVPSEVMGIEGFTVDGVTHMYFGLGPAVLRLPAALFGEASHGRLSVLSQLLAVGLLAVASARLLTRAHRAVAGRRAEFAAESVWPWAVFPAAVALATPVLFLASRPLVYHEAELWGAAAALAGLELSLAWWEDRRLPRLVAAGAMAAFAIASRPSSGSAPLVALGCFGLLCVFRREFRTAASALAASALASAGYVVVNMLRFGTLLSLPFEAQEFSASSPARQAALEANGGTLFGPQFLPTTVWHYLSPLPTSVRIERLAPFVDWAEPAAVLNGATFDTVDATTSLLVAAPLFVVLAAVGAWWALRRDQRWGWRVAALSAGVGAAGALTIGFIAHRYLVDMVPLLVVLSAPGWWVAWAWLASRSLSVRRVVLGVALAVALTGAYIQGALALRGHFLTILPEEQDRRSFVEWRYDLDERLFGDPPPKVTVLSAAPTGDLPEVPHGHLVVVGDCDAMYLVQRGDWEGIEWAPNTTLRQVVVPTERTARALGDRPVPVASGDGWRIVALPTDSATDDEVRLHLQVPGLDLDIPGDAASVGPDSVLDIVVDPTTSELSVSIDDTRVLATSFIPAGGLSRAPGWQPTAADEPWCTSLLDRLRPSD